LHWPRARRSGRRWTFGTFFSAATSSPRCSGEPCGYWGFRGKTPATAVEDCHILGDRVTVKPNVDQPVAAMPAISGRRFRTIHTKETSTMKFAWIALLVPFAAVLSGCAQLNSQLGAYGLAGGTPTLTRPDPYPLDQGKDCMRAASPQCSNGS
jgi:hypothetical protein